MDKYLKLRCVYGLLFGLDQEILNLEESEFATHSKKDEIVDRYYDAVKEMLSENPY